MENEHNPEKVILKPSVIHDDLPESKKVVHTPKKKEPSEEDLLPENPDRNYHHTEVMSFSSKHTPLTKADDDIWNGEDA
ncbi:hypothetical protein [Pedobacter sp. MW01-1-1]|uniref:hypothetical protein n=1 Tax=Pedobacter sp. MW01-1-1 TaxID=3383027 RepID=UPI003FF041A9